MQLHGAKDRLEKAGFGIILVGLGQPEDAEKFRKQYAPSLPVICDPEKRLYKAFSLGRASIASIASPGVLLRGMRTMAQGYTLGMPHGDVLQMPGVFMIDRQGYIRYSFFAKDVSDHPSIEDLLALKPLIDE